MSPGKRFRLRVAKKPPLQVPGAVNAYCALLAEKAGFEALYLSGAGVANASFGLPDLGITTLGDVLEDARRLTGATELPLLVDVDTGFGGAFNIARTVREMERAEVAAIHLEDQEQAKRCGHRPNKATVAVEETCDRLKAAVDARRRPEDVAQLAAYPVRSVRPRQVRAERKRHVVRPREPAQQRFEPPVGRRRRVLGQERHVRPERRSHQQVTGAAVRELRLRDLDDPGLMAAQHVERPVGRPAVDHDQLELWVEAKTFHGAQVNVELQSGMDLDENAAQSLATTSVTATGTTVTAVTSSIGAYVRLEVSVQSAATRGVFSVWVVPKRS